MKQIYIATNKQTGRTWFYETRTIFNRREFRHVSYPGSWSPSLKDARKVAEASGFFRWIDEGPMAYCTLDQHEFRI